MPQITILDGFLRQSVPLRVEESVVKVDRGLPDKIVAEEVIEVVNLDGKGHTTGECP